MSAAQPGNDSVNFGEHRELGSTRVLLPMVVVGGRAPQNRWGSGSLQEIDQPPLVETVTKLAATLPTASARSRWHSRTSASTALPSSPRSSACSRATSSRLLQKTMARVTSSSGIGII